MRIEEICRLTVADCEEGLFNIREAKTESGVRQVPIHFALKDIVGKRSRGKDPGSGRCRCQSSSRDTDGPLALTRGEQKAASCAR